MKEIKRRYSKQRESIYRILQDDTSHPTVETIYHNIRKEIPDISLGTVYRNLNFLAKSNRIHKLDFGDGSVHFDFQMKPHFHLFCEKCHQIYDIYCDEENIQAFLQIIQQNNHIQINHTDILFYGICHDCQNKTND